MVRESDILESVARIMGKGEPLSLSGPLESADAFFAYRLLLGRNPKLSEVSRFVEGMTVREFLTHVLDSPEFRGALPLLPAGFELESDLNGFRFRFRTGDREMGVRMGLAQYEPKVREAFQRLAPKCRTFVDCGAHTGFYTCLFLALAGENARAWALEPLPENFALLERNVAINGFEKRTSLLNVACGSSEATIEMSRVAGMMVGCRINGRESARVRTVRLDDVIEEKVDLVKLDIEGAEPDALKGMQRIIESSRPILIVELNEYWLRHVSSSSSMGLVQMLESWGYDVVTLDAFLLRRNLRAKPPVDEILFVEEVVCVPAD
jgi:FkbM family methyltransferase